MQSQPENINPTLSNVLRGFLIIVALVVLFGSGLLWIPDLVRPRWPWTIAPFNSAFLGAIYLTELAVTTLAIITNRWAPDRLVLPVALTFLTVVSGVTLFYLDNFNYTKVATYAWFVAYFGSFFVISWYLWRYRNLPASQQRSMPPGWRYYMLGQGLVLLICGLGLLVLPSTFGTWWPWKVDAFHAQIYSGVFISGGLGSYLDSKTAARLELLALGIIQIMLGTTSIVGLLVVDSWQHRVDWSAPTTWIWLAAFGLLGLAGIALIGTAMVRRIGTSSVQTDRGIPA